MIAALLSAVFVLWHLEIYCEVRTFSFLFVLSFLFVFSLFIFHFGYDKGSSF